MILTSDNPRGVALLLPLYYKEARKVKESEKKILHDVGLLCRDYRIANGQTLKDVSIQMGCSLSTIGYFERGHNDSAKIVLWYVGHYKIPMEKIIKIYDMNTWGDNHE